MNAVLHFAAEVGLRVTTLRFPIIAQKTIILAAVYPHLKEIILFENQIDLYCCSPSRNGPRPTGPETDSS